MSWISGPCEPEPERNVVPPTDDEELGEEKLTAEDFWGGWTHFHRNMNEGNQRSYPQPRGTRDAG